MSDIIHKAVSGQEYYNKSAVTYVAENGTKSVLHRQIIPSGFYSGQISKLDNRFINTGIIDGGGA